MPFPSPQGKLGGEREEILEGRDDGTQSRNLEGETEETAVDEAYRRRDSDNGLARMTCNH